jgi:hypothetical protein
MSPLRTFSLFKSIAVFVCAFVLTALSASSALGAANSAPAWSLQSVAQPTSFSPVDNGNPHCYENLPYSDCDRYTIVLTNIGTLVSNTTITVTDTLPEGITTSHPPGGLEREFEWQCETEDGGPREVVVCKTEHSVAALAAAAAIEIPVSVSPSIPPGSTLTNEVTATGGEAAAPATSETPTRIDQVSEFAPFDFHFSAVNQAGGLDAQAAGRPGAFVSSFLFPGANVFKKNKYLPLPLEYVKQIVTDLPPGVVGDARAAPTCSLSVVTDLEEAATQCPSASVIGRLALIEAEETESDLVIFNVTPERGHAAEFAVFLPTLQHATFLYATVVGSGSDAHARIVSAPQSNVLSVVGISLTIFGDPVAIDSGSITPVALATNPSDCAATDFTTTMYVDSWEHPGRVEPDGQPDLSDPNWKRASSTSPPVTGCEQLQFHPSFSFAPEPEHSQADEPAGYESTLLVPQNEDPNSPATPPLKSVVVTLPGGVAVSPAAADGLVGCQEAGAEGIELNSPDGGHCPTASIVGSVEVVTPLLKEPLQGSVFVASPACGGAGQPLCTEEAAETGGVFALYLEAGSESSGVHIKAKGKVEIGGAGQHSREVGLAPGQVRTTFAETPQQPFSELKLKFHGGPRAALANPQTCGSFTSLGELEAWSHAPAPGEAQGTPNVTATPSFAISGCENRFSPGLSAGMVNPQAGAYSPFTLTFSRQDREQDLSGVTVDMPKGLLGKIAGIPRCGEAEADAGSCSGASLVGSATAAVGSGSRPFWQSGQVFLTGPYKGAPFGLSVVVPAKAGPFNLGNIVVRAAISIDPRTAQIDVVSDPLPQSVDGVPLRVQTVNVTIDREDFTFNPTNCSPSSVDAIFASAQGAQAGVATRFQAANCATLPFTPSFKATTQAETSKARGASLDVKLSFPSNTSSTSGSGTSSSNTSGSGFPGSAQANAAYVKVDLPKSLPSRLTTLQKACGSVVFETNPANCPPASIVAHAKAITPILNAPLEGPAYFVSHGNEAFPQLIAVLQGEGIVIDLVGDTFISKAGVTSSTFKEVPDAPITSFEMLLPQGPYSALAANGSLCDEQGSLKMPTELVGQNGAVVKQDTQIEVEGCSSSLSITAKKISKRTLGLTVYVPAAGKLVATGKGIGRASATSNQRGSVKLTLHQGRARKLRTIVKLLFTPTNGKKLVKRTAVKFVK